MHSKIRRHERQNVSIYLFTYIYIKGAQWLSERVLDSRPRGRGFEPHQRHCLVVLKQHIYPSLVLVQSGRTRPCLTERLLMGRKESNQPNTYIYCIYLSIHPYIVCQN